MLRLTELRLPLDPHFLFNALNGVAEEIPEHPTAALAMLRDVAADADERLEALSEAITRAYFSHVPASQAVGTSGG